MESVGDESLLSSGPWKHPSSLSGDSLSEWRQECERLPPTTFDRCLWPPFWGDPSPGPGAFPLPALIVLDSEKLRSSAKKGPRRLRAKSQLFPAFSSQCRDRVNGKRKPGRVDWPVIQGASELSLMSLIGICPPVKVVRTLLGF